MRVQTALNRGQAGSTETPTGSIAGILVSTDSLSCERAEEISHRLAVPAPDRITVAVPKSALDQALAGNRNLRDAGGFMQFALNPPPPLTSAAKPATGFSDRELKAIVGITRTASNFLVTHLWPNQMARYVVKGCWLAYDAHRLAQDWDDPKVSTLACVVDTSKLALDAFSLLDSTDLFGTDPMISDQCRNTISDTLSVIGDAEEGRNPAITPLGLWFKQNTRELEKLGDTEEVMHRDTYALAAKIVQAALNADPKFENFKLTPIPHFQQEPEKDMGWPPTQEQQREKNS